MAEAPKASEVIAASPVSSPRTNSIKERYGKRLTSLEPPSSQPQNASTDIQPQISSFRKAILFLGIFVTLFLSALDQTIVTTALPKIASSFSSPSGSYTWVGTAFTLAQAAVLPFYGQAAGLIGRRWTMLFAVTVFMTGSALCGSSQSMRMLIGSRAVQGMGAGGITGGVYILIGDLVSTQKRGTYQGVIGATWACASAIGPLLGGIFTQKVSWRWCFYVNLPVCALSLFIFFTFLHTSHNIGSFKTVAKSFDYPGIFTIVVSTLLILLAFEWGGTSLPWSSAAVICCLVFGVLGILAFVYTEAKVKSPLIPLRLFTHRTRVTTYICCFLHGVAYAGLSYYVPLYFQGVRGESPFSAGVSMLPLILAFALVSTVSGHIISITGVYKLQTAAGFALATLGVGLMTMLDQNSTIAEIVIYMIICGIGVGPNFNSLLIPIHASFDGSQKSDIATSSSTYAFIRATGSTLGISVCGVVFFNEMAKSQSNGLAGISATQGVELLSSMSPQDREEAVSAYSHAMRMVFVTLTVIIAVAFVSSLFIGRHELQKTVQTDHAIVEKRNGSSKQDNSC